MEIRKWGYHNLQYRLRVIGNINIIDTDMVQVHGASMQAWGHLGMAFTSFEVHTHGNMIGMIEVGSGWV